MKQIKKVFTREVGDYIFAVYFLTHSIYYYFARGPDANYIYLFLVSLFLILKTKQAQQSEKNYKEAMALLKKSTNLLKQKWKQ